MYAYFMVRGLFTSLKFPYVQFPAASNSASMIIKSPSSLLSTIAGALIFIVYLAANEAT